MGLEAQVRLLLGTSMVLHLPAHGVSCFAAASPGHTRNPMWPPPCVFPSMGPQRMVDWDAVFGSCSTARPSRQGLQTQLTDQACQNHWSRAKPTPNSDGQQSAAGTEPPFISTAGPSLKSRFSTQCPTRVPRELRPRPPAACSLHLPLGGFPPHPASGPGLRGDGGRPPCSRGFWEQVPKAEAMASGQAAASPPPEPAALMASHIAPVSAWARPSSCWLGCPNHGGSG